MTAFRERIYDTETWIGTSGVVARHALAPVSWPGKHPARLARLVEQQVIPRLVQAHRIAPPCNRNMPSMDPAEGVSAFAELVLSRDDAAAYAFVAARRAQGVLAESLHLGLLAPAARRLGEMWEEDAVSFVDVTLGLLRLHRVMDGIGGEREASHGPARRALLLPAPGDGHVFGTAMVADFFRRAGWTVCTAARAPERALAALVRRERFDLVGFSVSSSGCLDGAATAIRVVRRASCNPGVAVMVGGPVFLADPGLAALVGADGTAADGQQAVWQAECLLNPLPERV